MSWIRVSKRCRALLGWAILPVVLFWMAVPTAGQSGTKNGEWRFWGGDGGTTRYSPLDQINRDNVKNLRLAWRWKMDNFGPTPTFNSEGTPLMVNGVLFFAAGPRPHVVAIDAASGETLWMWRLDEGERFLRAPWHNKRGLAYWGQGDRIFVITSGYQLVGLDAKSGEPAAEFGTNGIVDLYEGLEHPTQPLVPEDGLIGSSSPPIVSHGVVVVGMSLQPGCCPKTKSTVPGDVRGYDARTGERLWTFHTIPQSDEFGIDTWENDSWTYTGSAAVWAPMAVDEELGYVYLPTDTPTGDYYGGPRLGDNLFANSLVCLDIRTGERIWHFQLTHHELWDYDIPTAPNLLDITVEGKRIKAVAQVTKQAFAYVFDRVTGQPVWPIVERPVPQSDVPGERASPTQPFPTKPAAFDRQGVTLDDLIDFTPELRAAAVQIASRYRMGPLFTPPSIYDPKGTRGTLVLPNNTGGANWPGAAADPETGILYVSSTTIEQVLALTHDPERSEVAYIRSMEGLRLTAPPPSVDAFVVPGHPLRPLGLPLFKPPWGRITAIDLNSGEHVWMIPNGDTPEDVKNHPALKGVQLPKTGRPDKAGLLVTKTLLFAGEGSGIAGASGSAGGGGSLLRAIDKTTGEIIYEYALPANQSGHPITYLVGGKQYIVLGVGARGVPAELVALTVD